jgi:probable phosphoglycerate mutase
LTAALPRLDLRLASTLVLVRHGESTWNRSARIQGHDDTARLTAQGRRQSHEAAAQLTTLDLGVIVSSDLHRAVETARIIAEILNLDTHTTPMLRERNLGVLEGLPSIAFDSAQSGIEHGRVLDVHARPANGESIDDLFRRTAAFVEELVAQGVDRPLLVTHGGPIRTILAYCRGTAMAKSTWYEVANASIWSVGVGSQ